MKYLLFGLIAFAIWIHFSPQIETWRKSNEYGIKQCAEVGYDIHAEWDWFTLRFYDIAPYCNWPIEEGKYRIY